MQFPAVPWREGSDAFLERVQQQIGLDSLVLGVLNVRQPRAEGLMVAQGVAPDAVGQWCDRQYKQDAMLREARRRGLAVGQTEADAAGPPLPAGQQAMVHLQVANAVEGRAWYLVVGRSGEPFTDREQKLASLLLRSLQVEFDQCEEPGLGRIMLGLDNRLIHADPGSEANFVSEPETYHHLIDAFQPTVEQRWPELEDQSLHDMVLSLNGRPTWIRFYRGGEVDGLEVRHWYLELRPVSEDDVPPLGVLEDERIARAVAYLTDNYQQAPSLSEVARSVSTSPFHFHRLFSRQVGLSPKHFLLRMQLQIAKWLLAASRIPIGDIAGHTGFASHGHFTATFHRTVGVSPTEYREQS
jgi:AraC-like DNA-binding protein